VRDENSPGDCSGDGSVEALRRARPELDLIVAPQNRGVIANFNAAAREMRSRGMDAILCLTHETLLEVDVLERRPAAGRASRSVRPARCSRRVAGATATGGACSRARLSRRGRCRERAPAA
jgi:glycosyltransferase involved in cell wall biosynthesis